MRRPLRKFKERTRHGGSKKRPPSDVDRRRPESGPGGARSFLRGCYSSVTVILDTICFLSILPSEYARRSDIFAVIESSRRSLS